MKKLLNLAATCLVKSILEMFPRLEKSHNELMIHSFACFKHQMAFSRTYAIGHALVQLFIP